MKKISHTGKEVIALFVLFIISAIVWLANGIEEAMSVIHLYFLLHFIYSFLKIGIMEEELEGKDYRINKLSGYIECLEEELKKAQNSHQD